MALDTNRAKLRPVRSATAGARPAAGELFEGEIFVNTTDKVFGIKNAAGALVYFVDSTNNNNNSFARLNVNQTFTGENTFTGVATFTQTIQGTANRALWADLAEIYEADDDYEPGTLVRFGGKKEITLATADQCNGVISTRPGFLMNDKELEHGLPLTVAGRVPVKVRGRVNKFDYLVLSSTPGVAEAIPPSQAYLGLRTIIGRALRSNHQRFDKISTVLATVQLNLL